MKMRTIVLTSAALAAAGCAGRARTAPPQPSPAQALSGPVAPPLAASAASTTLPPLAPALVIEPAACALYAGDDRPDIDAAGLKCIVEWMRQTRSYLALGGKPTKYTNAQAFERYKKEAATLQARLAAYTRGAGFEPAPETTGAADAAPAPDGPAYASQAFLSGMIAFQKGDYVGARSLWSQAAALDPGNADAKDGLARLDRLEGKP